MIIFLCLLGLAATWYMTGVVWFCQIVHYPLLDRGDRQNFPSFAFDYQRRTGWVVVPGLALELVSAVGLVFLWPHWLTWLGLGLLGVVWALTIACQIPAHAALKDGFSERAHRNLVRYNFPRSVAWLLRALVLVATVWYRLPVAP